MDKQYVWKLLLYDEDFKLPEDFENTIKRSILLYGKTRQLLCLVEEISEFLLEFDKLKNVCPLIKSEKSEKSELIKELADVLIAIDTVKILYSIRTDDFEEYKTQTSTIPTALYELMIGVSHIDRGRITINELTKLIGQVYNTFRRMIMNFMDSEHNKIDDMDELLAQAIELKYAKFKKQVHDPL